jgi:hypothetical protein
MKVITYEMALEALKAAVAERGEDYEYGADRRAQNEEDGYDIDCFYINPETDEPDCGVGVALASLGVPKVDLEYGEGMPAFALTRYLMDSHDFDFDLKARNLLSRFQEMQDRGVAWGESLQLAVSHIENTSE